MQSETTITVFAAEDDRAWRELVANLLAGEDRIQVVGFAASCDEAIERIAELRPDVVLLDLRLRGGDGIRVLSEALAAGSQAAFVVVSADGSNASVNEAIEAGAIGYLSKPASGSEIRRAIVDACEGRPVLGEGIVRGLVEEIRGSPERP